MTKFYRIISVDMDGFAGRENHPQPSDVGLIVALVSVATTVGGYREPAIGTDGRVVANAADSLFAAAAGDYFDVEQVLTCLTRDGRVLDLMPFEIEDVAASIAADVDDACPTCGNHPGDGVGCDDPDGCGFGRDPAAEGIAAARADARALAPESANAEYVAAVAVGCDCDDLDGCGFGRPRLTEREARRNDRTLMLTPEQKAEADASVAAKGDRRTT